MTTFEFLAPWPKQQAKYVRERNAALVLRDVGDDMQFKWPAVQDPELTKLWINAKEELCQSMRADS